MHRFVRQVVFALLLSLAWSGSALADDLRLAQNQLEEARKSSQVGNDFRRTREFLDRARRYLPKLAEADRARLEAEIAEIARVADAEEARYVNDGFMKAIGRVFSSIQSQHERNPTNVDGAIAALDEKLAEAMTWNDARFVDDEVRARIKAMREEFVAACRTRKVEYHFDQAERRLSRIEGNAENLSEDSLAEWLAFFDEHLSPQSVPQNDPRVAQMKARLEAFLKQHQAATQQAATQEKIERATEAWASEKRDFERDNPAWSAELPSEFSRWVQTGSLGVEKAARRQEVAAKFLEDARYKDVVQWFGADPAVQQLKAEVEGWRVEGATKVVAAADALLAEAEQRGGEAGLSDALQRLITTVEARGAGAPGQAATLARARAIANGGVSPSDGAVDGPRGEDDAPSGGLGGAVKVLLGLVCCFGFLAVVGVVGFLAYKQMNPPAPPAA